MGFAIGSTVTGGIQDVSALLPLLGTEQCEGHVGSALDDGYLYSSAASLSIFGSLGFVKAGFKACVAGACFAFRSKKIVGAKKLAEAGFKPVGKAMSLIHWDGKRHKAESRFIELLDELHLRDMSKLTIESKTRRWNFYMFLTSLLAIILSFTPYIYFIERSHSEPILLRWIFPIARSFGSMLTATMIQLVIQTRILQIVKYRMVFMTLDGTVKQAAKNGWIALPDSWDPLHPSEKALYDLDQHIRSGDESSDDGQQDEFHHERRVRRHPVQILRRISLQTHRRLRALGDRALQACRYPLRVLSNLSRVRNNDMEMADEDEGHVGHPGTQREQERVKLKAALDGVMNTHLPSAMRSRFRWTLLVAQISTLIGIVLSLAGYVGCFSLVQNSQTSVGPLIWLSCEVALSLLRLVIWSWNPNWDESASMSLKLQLSPGRALPSCTQSTEELDESKKLPLMRAREFLNSVTSCVGLVAPFDGGTGAVYYTLSASLVTGLKTLYATIYDYKENLTRIVIRRPSEGGEARFDFHVATLNDEHDEATIGDTIPDSDKDEVVVEHPDFFVEFEKHCNSIVRDGSSDGETFIKLLWEVRADERGEKGGSDARGDVGEHDRHYVSMGLMEKAKAELDVKREDWVEEYMNDVTQEGFIGLEEEEGSKDLVTVFESAVAEVLLLHEWWEMEKMLMDGSRRVEVILRRRYESTQKDLEDKREKDGTAARLEDIRKKNTAGRLVAEVRKMEERLSTLR